VRVLDQNTKIFSFSNIVRIFAVVLLVLVCIGLAATGAHAQASNIYITPDGAGSGVCTSNVHTPSWFNTSANWGNGAAQIGPGTIVHLCGTFTGAQGTTMLTAQGSGVNGRPVTILFEVGTILTSPAWAGITGAINIAGRSYIVVDGGTNGIVQNTDNGTKLGLHQNSRGIYAGDSNNTACTPGCRVTNLTIANIYVHVPGSCEIDQEAVNAISAWPNATGFRLDHNTLHDSGWAVSAWGNNLEVDHNNIYNMDHGPAGGMEGNNISGMLIHDNHIHDFANWDSTANCYHHDGIHFWNTDPGTTSNIAIYNNVFDGDSGVDITSFVYFENRVSGVTIFNNVFSLQASRQMAGMVWMGNYYDAAPRIINNTFLIPGGLGAAIRLESNSNVTWENNLITGGNTFLSFVNETGNTTITTGDYNEYEVKGPGGNYSYSLNGFQTDSLSSWQSSTGQDVNSHYYAALSVNPGGTLKSGSPAIRAGKNLTSLGITALNSDITGAPRPTTGAWDVGAYSSGTSTAATSPLPPTNVKATVQ
jgi:hypothetical protein